MPGPVTSEEFRAGTKALIMAVLANALAQHQRRVDDPADRVLNTQPNTDLADFAEVLLSQAGL